MVGLRGAGFMVVEGVRGGAARCAVEDPKSLSAVFESVRGAADVTLNRPQSLFSTAVYADGRLYIAAPGFSLHHIAVKDASEKICSVKRREIMS